MGKLLRTKPILIGATIVALIGVGAPEEIGQPIVLLWSLLCSGAMFVAARRQTGSVRSTVLLLAVTAAMVASGILIRGIHGEIVGESQPMPSPADLIHVPAYVLFIFVAWRIHMSRAARRDIDAWLDAVAIVLATVIFLWVGFAGDFIADSSFSVGVRSLNTVYNSLVLVALSLFIRIIATPGDRPISYYLFGFAGFSFLIADLAASYSLTHDGGVSLTIGLSPFVFAFALAASVHPSTGRLLESDPAREVVIGPVRLAIVGLSIVAPVAASYLQRDPVGSTRFVLFAGSVLLTTIVIVRVVRLILSQRNVADTERRLSSELAALAVLDSPEAIVQHLPPALRHVIPELQHVVVARATNSNERIELPLPDSLRRPGVEVLKIDAATLTPTAQRVSAALLRDAGLVAASVDGIAASARLASEAEANKRIAQNERRFRSLVQHSSDIIAVVDPAGVVKYVSDSVEAGLGYAPAELVGRPIRQVVHRSDIRSAYRAFKASMDNKRSYDELELRGKHADKSTRLFEIVITNMMDIPEVNGLVLNLSDVTANRQLERDLKNAETTDPLTLQLNRSSMIAELEVALRRTDVSGIPLSLAIIDLNNFKLVNDSLGPILADQALIECADRIRRHVRLGDSVARLNGDEFGVLMRNGYSTVESISSVERILQALAEPFILEGKSVELSATAGIALNAGEDVTALEVLRQADTAMSIAKATNRGGALIFEEEMGREVSQRMELRNGFARALENGELRLVYQPILSIRTGRIESLEALARWNHPILGAIPPSTFIPMAEESDRINEIGTWALRSVCEQIVAWERSGLSGFSVSVNMSGLQLRDDATVKQVADILEETGVRPESLTIEITESVLIDDSDFTAQRISAIRSLGVSLAIDDFGTGYSSLSYLQRYEFDILKIDRAFVDPLDDGDRPREREIVRSIISLAKGLNATTVAEGVETQEEFDVLADLGCSNAQGYLLHYPLEIGDATEVLARERLVSQQPAA